MIGYRDLNLHDYKLVKMSVLLSWSLSPLGQTFGKGKIDEKGVCGESKGKLGPTAPSGVHEHELVPKDRLEPVLSPILVTWMSHQCSECLCHRAKHTPHPAFGGTDGESGKGEQLQAQRLPLTEEGASR